MRDRVDRPGAAGAGRRWGGWALVIGMTAGLLAGCPTYEDSYSGTYRERSPNPAAADRGRQSVEIDFFRYGDHAKAILRYFEPDNVDDEPYGDETFCTWTRVDQEAFRGESRGFELPVRKTTEIPDGRLDGEILNDGTMEATLYNADTGEEMWETVTLDRVERTPDDQCEGVEEFLVRPTFELPNRRPNRLPEGTDHTIEHPVLTVQWVTFQRETGERTNRTLVPIGDQGWAGRIDELSEVSFDGEQFRNSLSILLPPPPDKILSSSDSTQFAIGHIAVVDDGTGDERFRWNVDTEPIVASALQSGVWPDGPGDANASGKAILYVDGDIEDLADDLGNFQDSATGLQPRIAGLEDLGESEVPDRSFFVADMAVDRRNHLIVQLDVQPRVTDSTIPIQATDWYLNEGFAPLPRLLP